MIPVFNFEGISGLFEVLKVIDGDTVCISIPIELKVNDINKSGIFKINIRLMGINTPEVGDNGYLEAKERLIQLVKECNNHVFIKLYKFDKYGRVLGELFKCKDSEISFNKIILDEGLARIYI